MDRNAQNVLELLGIWSDYLDQKGGFWHPTHDDATRDHQMFESDSAVIR